MKRVFIWITKVFLLVGILAMIFLVAWAFQSRTMPELRIWHTASLSEEFTADDAAPQNSLQDYLDRSKRPWIHLVDGGISDNLGLRSFYTTVSLIGDPHAAFNQSGHPDVRHILIISVNAHTRERTGWVLKRAAPSLLEVIGSIISDQIDRCSLDTIDIVRSAFTRWTEEISTPERPLTFNFVEVSFDAVRDGAQCRHLNNIGTNFSLSDKQVNRLILNARKVLRGSAEFEAFLDYNQGQ